MGVFSGWRGWVICAEFDVSLEECGERVVKTEFVMHISGTRVVGAVLGVSEKGFSNRRRASGPSTGACSGLVRGWIRRLFWTDGSGVLLGRDSGVG